MKTVTAKANYREFLEEGVEYKVVGEVEYDGCSSGLLLVIEQNMNDPFTDINVLDSHWFTEYAKPNGANSVRSSLQEFVDYYKDMKYMLNDEMIAMIERAENALKNIDS